MFEKELRVNDLRRTFTEDYQIFCEKFGNILMSAWRLPLSPGIILNEIVSVQPMSLPSGLLFYMDYRYESKGWNREHIGACDGIGKTSTIIADPKMFPHKCPRCSAPAYVGFMKVDCSRKSCI